MPSEKTSLQIRPRRAVQVYESGVRTKRAAAARFGRMFPGLPPQGSAVSGDVLSGWLSTLGQTLQDDTNPGPATHPNLPAGYTYLGQFVDHDLTLDPTALPTQPIDITALSNFRSPSLDLDCLLGHGPGVHPWLYESHSAGPLFGRLRTANSVTNPAQIANDSPRLANGVPLIGDPRNDENLVVGQLHTAFITFFNKIFDDLQAGQISDVGPEGGRTTEKAARLAQWHYQWLILHDFLPRLVLSNIMAQVLNYGPQHFRPDPGNPYMPVEFAGAAYRLGHSMVRENYHVNQHFPNATLMDLFTFSSSGGGVPVPSNWFLNWNRFFPIDPATAPNLAMKLDPYSTPGLQNLPGVPPPASLPVRNLLRGWTWGLPSGQAVAGALGLPALSPAEILMDASGHRFKEADVVEGFGFHQDSPLWYYILKEAQVQQDGLLLGEIGSTILCEVFVGLLKSDLNSYLNVMPGWSPTLPSSVPGNFTMPDLFRYLPVGAINPNGGDQDQSGSSRQVVPKKRKSSSKK